MPTPFLIALQFLTRLPVRSPGEWQPREIGRSLLWYPLVGLILGLILLFAAGLLAETASLVAAAIILLLWVGLTGALHLDGLADSADAWLGGFGDRARTLEIMKDPASGPAGVVSVVLVLLLKFAALATLAEGGDWLPLLIAVVLARSAMLGLFLSTSYVRPGGLGEALAEHLSRGTAKLILVTVAALTLLFVGSIGLWQLLAAVLVLWLLRRVMLARLGGTTGDTAGALLEVTEAVCLTVAAL